MTFSEIAGRFRRAVRNRTRLHLDEGHVKALLDAGFYEWITARENQEMLKAAQVEADRSPEHGSPPKSRRHGAESVQISDEVIARAANQRLEAAIARLRQQGRSRRRSD